MAELSQRRLERRAAREKEQQARKAPKSPSPAPLAKSTYADLVGGPPTKAAEYWSPELEQKKKALLATDYQAQPAYAETLRTNMQALMTPQTMPTGTSEAERQAVYNQAKTNIAGQQAAGMQGVMDEYGGRGLRDSGFADTARAGVARAGAAAMANLGQNLAQNEINTRFQQGMDLNNLNLQRAIAGGNFGGLLNQIEQGGISNAFRAGEFGLQVEQAGAQAGQAQQELAAQREQAAISADLQRKGMAAGAARARAAQVMEQKRFEQQVANDEWNQMMQLYGMAQGQQEDVYDRWGNAIRQGIAPA